VTTERDMENMLTNGMVNGLLRQVIVWAKGLLVVTIMFVFILLIKSVEKWVYAQQPISRRLHRARFEYLEHKMQKKDKYHPSYSWDYWSDEDEYDYPNPTLADPDVAYLNFINHYPTYGWGEKLRHMFCMDAGQT